MGAVVAKEEAHIAERADWFDEDAPPTAVLQRLCFAPRDKRDGASYADDGYSDSALLRSRAERGRVDIDGGLRREALRDRAERVREKEEQQRQRAQRLARHKALVARATAQLKQRLIASGERPGEKEGLCVRQQGEEKMANTRLWVSPILASASSAANGGALGLGDLGLGILTDNALTENLTKGIKGGLNIADKVTEGLAQKVTSVTKEGLQQVQKVTQETINAGIRVSAQGIGATIGAVADATGISAVAHQLHLDDLLHTHQVAKHTAFRVDFRG